MGNDAGRFRKLSLYKTCLVLVMVFLYPGYSVEASAGFTIKERFLLGYQIQDDFETDWMGCLLKCIDHSECVSYNYHTKRGFCQLNDHGIQHASMAEVVLLSGTSYIFHQLKPVTNGRVASPRTPQKCTCNCGADTQCTTDNRPGLGDKPELAANSCQEILRERSDATDGPYYLNTFPNKTYTFCHMTEIPGCGGGGWTLVIKIDGKKQTFKYDSSLWDGMQPYEPSNGADLSETETLLPTYWFTSFSRLCLGMKYDDDTNWIPINYNATTLLSVFSTGDKKETRLDVSQWKSLLRNSSLQTSCTIQGFNIWHTVNTASARIGITGFPGDCSKSSSTSRIGFGTGGNFYDMDGDNTCGNEARNNPDNGDRSIKAFGYIFIQ